MGLGHYKVMVFSSTPGKVRQFKISTTWIRLGILSLVVSFLLGAGGLYLFLSHFEERKQLKALLQENSCQQSQIEEILTDMGSLRQRLVRLHGVEKKIRIIANLEKPDSEMPLTGMGGPSPEEGMLEDLKQNKKDEITEKIQTELDKLTGFVDKQQAGFNDLESQIQDRKTLLACTPSIKPTKGWVTAGFGYRQSPFTGLREFHRGLDIAARKGTTIISPADGVVVATGTSSSYGNTLKIDHGFGYCTFYAHLDKTKVKRGQQIHRGQVIASVGNTGRTTGPHLHYELHVNGSPVNPMKYILN